MADHYIPKEKLTAYEKYELAAFDAPPAAAATVESHELPDSHLPVTPLPTAEELERIHEEARQAGHTAGYAEGREQGHGEGYAQGYGEGHAAGQAEGLVEMRTQAARFAALTEHLDSAARGLDQAVADDVLALALEVARQVIRQSLRVRPELLLPVVREALVALPHAERPVLHLNPDDATLVRDQLGEQLQHAGWRIIEDMTVQAGSCKVEAGNSEVEGSLESRWKRTLEAIGLQRDWLD